MKSMKITVSLLLIVLFQSTSGQVTDAEKKIRTITTDTIHGWRKGGVIVLNLAQTSLKNWAAGGENSVAVNGLFSVFANYKKDKIAWDNSLDVGYGFIKQGGNSKKTDDKIDILSKFGKEAFKNFYYAALLNFKTQMAPGYNYPNDSVKISKFLAPAYIVGALGMDFKPNSYLSVFLAPITGRITIVNDQELADAGQFGVEKAVLDAEGNVIKHGEKIRTEFGGYMRMIYSKNDFKNEFLKNVSFTTKIDLFSNYLKKPQNIAVNWETQIALKVNKYLGVNINTQLIYDDATKISIDKNNDGIIDVRGPRIQFKEILGVGFSYKF
jgi:hypothetical protein